MNEVIGKEIGNFLVLDVKRENKRTWYLCKCLLCNNIKWIRQDRVKVSKSCGCLRKQTQFKLHDLSGQRFGRLEVTDQYKTTKEGVASWLCKCDCGNYKWITNSALMKHTTNSCGCLNSELASERGKKIGNQLFQSFKEMYLRDNTNIKMISKEKPQKNNKSGKTGVCWDKDLQKWRAYITFQGKRYKLGAYKDKEDAIRAREEAEEKLHKKYLEGIKMISKLKENLNGNALGITFKDGSKIHGVLTQINDEEIELQIVNTFDPIIYKKYKIDDIKDFEVVEPYDWYHDEDLREYHRTEYGAEYDD